MKYQANNNIKILLVFDVPAESGGALSILKEHYNEAAQDKNKKWVFIISLPEFMETDNVKILRFPWVKKSWIHRLYFDNFVAPKLVKKYKADEILSLQNVIVPRIKVPQTVYVHQSLPFIDKRFKIRENLLFWVYQNIIGKKIFKSMQKANKVIVQTNWMKNACIEKANIKPEKIVVISPKINTEIKRYFEPTYENLHTFFYPAGGLVYKNHKVIVNAVLLLKERGVKDYKVIFTLKENENEHIMELYKQIKENNLPIEFIGALTSQQVYEYYSKSVLIFPSYIETFGLPMLEAKMHGTPILASNCPFSHEILDEYKKAQFFEPEDYKILANYMEKAQFIIKV
jgi:glycosyltransferase involved in cell wall biosynthesis